MMTYQLATQGLEGERDVVQVTAMDARPINEVDATVPTAALLVGLPELPCGHEAMKTAPTVRIGTLDLQRFELGHRIG